MYIFQHYGQFLFPLTSITCLNSLPCVESCPFILDVNPLAVRDISNAFFLSVAWLIFEFLNFYT